MAQEVPAHCDELTATDFPVALDKSSQTCILPFGILEKHGPHSPLGTDLIHVRPIIMQAKEAKQLPNLVNSLQTMRSLRSLKL